MTELQHPSVEGICVAVRERTMNGRSQTFSKHEAVGALLEWGMTPWWLGPVRPRALSVPNSAVDSVSLAKLLSEFMLNSENEQKLVDATSEPPRLCQDPKLAGSRLACKSFIRTLFWKGLVRFSSRGH